MYTSISSCQKNLLPNTLSKQEFTDPYFNFCILCSDHNATNTSNKRKASSDLTDNPYDSRTTIQIISPEQKMQEILELKIIKGNYFPSRTTKKLFDYHNYQI